jgi:hypothetical protein
VSRLLPGSVSHLVAQSRGGFSQPSFFPTFGFDDLSEVFTEIRPLAPDAAGTPQYSVFDFGPLLSNGALPHGLFFLKVAAWDPSKKEPLPDGPSDGA